VAVIIGDPLAFSVGVKAESASGQLTLVVRLRMANRAMEIQRGFGHCKILRLKTRQFCSTLDIFDRDFHKLAERFPGQQDCLICSPPRRKLTRSAREANDCLSQLRINLVRSGRYFDQHNAKFQNV
jgi:hypothetical protein